MILIGECRDFLLLLLRKDAKLDTSSPNLSRTELLFGKNLVDRMIRVGDLGIIGGDQAYILHIVTVTKKVEKFGVVLRPLFIFVVEKSESTLAYIND